MTTTIKREINTKTATKSTKTAKNTGNVFKLDEKNMTLTLTLPVEWNATHSMLKAKNLNKVDGKDYQKLVFTDTKGNEVLLFKTGFNYEPVVKEEKTKAITKKDMSALSNEEQEVLTLLLKKIGK